MGLLRNTEVNHWVKLLFKWVYWNLLLPGVWLGPHELELAGKRLDVAAAK
ncbi:MAG: hypothetical protein AB1634_07950 [Thermodesulfobacteriota bacterium]